MLMIATHPLSVSFQHPRYHFNHYFIAYAYEEKGVHVVRVG